MRILVIGAGAIGSVAGGFMAEAGHEVTLVGRPAHVDAVCGSGLHISGIWGEHHITGLAAQSGIEGLRPGAFDLVLVCVKSYNTREVVTLTAPLAGEETLYCAYQNGLGNAEIVAEHVGWHRTVGARVIFGARLVGPGHAEVTVIAAPTALGVYDAAAPAGRVRDIAARMDAAGMPTVYSEDIAAALWGKVAYNCALNPLSALLDVPYGRLAENPHTYAMIEQIIGEFYAVAHAEGIALEPATADGYRKHFFERLLPPTAAHYASMREDLRLGRRTEIDSINGAIVRYGEAHGVPCPINRFLSEMIRARECLG